MGFINVIVMFALGLSLVAGLERKDMCEHPPIMKDFKLHKIAGRWYELARLPNLFQYFVPERCHTQYMTVHGKNIHFNTSMIEEETGARITFTGKLSDVPEQPGTLKVTMYWVGLEDYLNVIDAVYDDYLILHHCKTIGYFRWGYGWILTRQQHVGKEKTEILVQKLTKYIKDSNMQYENQDNC